MAYAKESVIVKVVVVLSHFGLANSHRHRYNHHASIMRTRTREVMEIA